MLFLFVLISISSAYDYLINKNGAEASVYVLDKCWNYIEDEKEKSMNIVEEQGEYLKYDYDIPDCDCGDYCVSYPIKDIEDYEHVTELPEYLVYAEEDTKSTKCENPDSPFVELILDGCFDVSYGNDKLFIKYEIKNEEEIISKSYKDAECTEELIEETDETILDNIVEYVAPKCDECRITSVTSSIKYVCGSSKIVILSLLMIFIFIF